MIKIRQLFISNFRSIESLTWYPSPGINCLIGPGDSGKSSILDAVELCLGVGSRTAASLNDTDFRLLNPKLPIFICLTLGGLNEELLDLEDFGLFLRGFDLRSNVLYEEPGPGFETVITLKVSIDEYREPTWALHSDRAHAKGLAKRLSRRDREALFSARLSSSNTSKNLAWSPGSVLSRLTDETLNVNASLIEASRLAKSSFGEKAGGQIGQTLAVVQKAAESLGVKIGGGVKALLDTQFLSLREGAVSLHANDGVPLRCLGTGSTRLLVAGLLKEVSQAAPVVLVDEIELGLEPHRLTKLLNALGSKEEVSPSQVFITTHSPVALQQLRSEHLKVVRREAAGHRVLQAGTGDEIQGLVRKSPSSFLADKVIVCEGASEMGLLRGIDDFYVADGANSLLAHGVSLCDAGGGSPRSCMEKAILFAQLGYTVAVFIDNDVPIRGDSVARFQALGGTLFTWPEKMALEDALFEYSSDAQVTQLLDLAFEFVGADSMNAKLVQAGVPLSYERLRDVGAVAGYPPETRALIAKASRTRKDSKTGEPEKKSGWYKRIERMEPVGLQVVGPELVAGTSELCAVLNRIAFWSKT